MLLEFLAGMISTGKTKITFLLFISVVLSGCGKEQWNRKHEIVLTIQTRSVDATGNDRFFVLIENPKSKPVFRELQNYTLTEITRDDSVKGNEINIHLISLNTFGGQHYLNINSYAGVPIGRSILLGKENILQEKSGSVVKLEFANVPDFDVVTRSAHLQQLCYTQTDLINVPDADIGGNTFPANQTFYACLEKNGKAGFITEKVDLTHPSFLIPLDSLNYHMILYSLPKTIDNIPLENISVTANIYQIGALAIYNLSDFSIFPGQKVDLFVPDSAFYIYNFNMTFQAQNNTNAFESTYLTDTIITHPAFINATLKAGPEINRNLDFSTSGNFDFVKIRMSGAGSTWILYGNDSQSMYVPDLPSDLTDIIGLPDFMDQADTSTLGLYDYSEVDGYQEALDYLLDDSKEFMQGTNKYYLTLKNNIPFSNQN